MAHAILRPLVVKIDFFGFVPGQSASYAILVKNGLLKFCLLASLLVAGGLFWFLQRPSFPYSVYSADVQIAKKEQNPHGLVYSIKSGDIDGEAILTSAPTVNVGDGIVNSALVGVKSTFLDSHAPYAGHITSRVECTARKYVREEVVPFEGQETKAILAVATSRRIFGSCLVEEIKHASVIWAAYDEPRKQVVTVRLFKPIQSVDQIEASQSEILKVFKKVINDQRRNNET